MEKQTCSSCKIEYDLSEDFYGTYTYKGNRKWIRRCKQCMSDYKKSHYNKNKEPYLERSKAQREANHEEYLAYLKEYQCKNKERLSKKSLEYRNSPKGKEASQRASAKYRQTEAGKLKESIRGKVNYALKKGKITKPDNCSQCKAESNVEAHHEDYSKPLDIIWLCKSCHESLHHSNGRDISNG